MMKKKKNHLIVFDTLYGEVVAVVPESTSKHADTISLHLLEHLERVKMLKYDQIKRIQSVN